MSTIHKTATAKNRGAVASSALAICFVIAGVVTPAHAGCKFYPTASVNWSAYSAQQTSSQYGAANTNGLVSVQPAAGANTSWSTSNYTFYGRYGGAANQDRQPLDTSNFYRRAPGLQRGRRIDELNTVRPVWRAPQPIERVEILRGAAGSAYGRPSSHLNQIQSLPRNQFTGSHSRVQIRGIGANQNLQYGRSLVQFNGQPNLANQVTRINVVGYRPAARTDVRAAGYRDR